MFNYIKKNKFKLLINTMKKGIQIFCIFFFSITMLSQKNKEKEMLSLTNKPKASIDNKKVQSASIKPFATIQLDSRLKEISGLVYWNTLLWGHNDDTDTNLYSINPISGIIEHNYLLPKVKNKDWEEIAQDSIYFYLGDFGNNVKGNRVDLHLLRIRKQSLLNDKIAIDTIAFSYSNQLDFEPKKPNKTDFDCEAMVVSKDSIYLFTKQWSSKKTSVYSLPKKPGNYIAKFKETFDVDGLITGATFCERKKLIVMCGYSSFVKPFVYILYDYKENHFFSGKTIKVEVELPFHQVEGIATVDYLHYFLSNEAFVRKPFFTNLQQLHSIDLSPYLASYLKN